MWSLVDHLPFFGRALLIKIVLSVVIFLTSFMLLKGSEFLCMVLIRIVFLVLIILVLLSFSYVLMEPVKSQVAQALNVIPFFSPFFCERSG